MKRDTRTAYRARTKATEASVDAAVAAVEAEQAARFKAAKTAETARRAGLPTFTATDLTTATHVRTRHGWHEITRINAKTVTVKTGHSWDDRIPLGKIEDWRCIPCASDSPST